VMPQKLSQEDILRLFDKQVQEEAESERESPEHSDDGSPGIWEAD
jgi:hypothetical protein